MASRLTAAMEEAYASAPANVVFLHTIELNIPGDDAPVRLVVGDEGWPEDRTNLMANSAGVGGVPGVTAGPSGSPSIGPTYWSAGTNGSGGGSITGKFIGTGSEKGVPYVEIEINGTIAGWLTIGMTSGVSSALYPILSPSTSYAGALGLSYVSGTITGTGTISPATLNLRTYNASNASDGSDTVLRTGIPIPTALPSAVTRYEGSKQTRATTAKGIMFLQWGVSGTLTVTNLRLRVSVPQLELGTVATPPVLTTGTAPVTIPANTIQLTLEDGTIAAVTATAFDILPPGVDDDGPTEGKIVVDGVSGELTEVLESAAVTAGSIGVTYRNYRSDARFEPGEVITGLKAKAASVTATRVEGTIGFSDVGEQAFPRAIYDKDYYPGLYTAQR